MPTTSVNEIIHECRGCGLTYHGLSEHFVREVQEGSRPLPICGRCATPYDLDNGLTRRSYELLDFAELPTCSECEGYLESWEESRGLCSVCRSETTEGHLYAEEKGATW